MKIYNNLTPNFTSGFTYNYLYSSEDFSNTTYWTVSNASVTTNTVNDPVYGKLTADTITSSNSITGLIFQNLDYTSIVNNKNTVYSVYVKSNTSSGILVSSDSLSTTSGTYTTTYFQVNLSTGSVVATTTYDCVLGVCSVISSGNRGGKVDNIGNGWYRISFFDTPINYGAGTISRFSLYPDASATNKSIYAWGAQVELTTATTATQAFASLPSKYISTSAQEILAEFSYPYKFPIWSTNNINGKEYSKALKALTNSIAETLAQVTTFGNFTAANEGSVFAPNGFIYRAPNASGVTLKLNPSTDTLTTISNTTGINGHVGATLSSDGNIYYIPFSATRVLKLNPDTDTFTAIGTTYASGGNKWWGGAVAPNGKIYAAPFSATSVLVINPATDTTSILDLTASGFNLAVTSGWAGAVLAPNGNIYCVPFTATRVLKINPTTDTPSLLAGTISSPSFTGGVLAPNGMIYCVPYEATVVLKINPTTDTTTTFGSLSGSTKWAGGVLAPNGMIYCAPRNETRILEINPSTDTTTYIGTLSSATQKWTGFTVAPNGNIYSMPYTTTSVLKVNLGISSDIPQDYLLSRYNNGTP